MQLGDRYLDGISNQPSPYIRWAIIVEITEADICQKNTDTYGNIEPNIVLTHARSASVKWLDGSGGRDSVRFIEPIGATSMPMKGAVVAVGFTGPMSEPIILGSWTSGYRSRTGYELGDLRAGQEVWRRSALAFRIVPYYDDLREFSSQYNISPWSLDLIMGEQHDQACFCPRCQTRYPAHADYVDGKPVYSCQPKECEVCSQNKVSSQLILVKGSVSPGEGLAWAELQADLLVSTLLKGIFDKVDENVIGKYIPYIDLQQDIRQYLRRYLYTELGPVYTSSVREYFSTGLTGMWRELLTTYVRTGDILTTMPSDVPGGIGSTLVPLLRNYVDGWIQTVLHSYLMGKDNLSETERKSILTAMSDNLKSYINDYVPGLISQSAHQFVYNKSKTYISETLAKLRRGAVNWVYKAAVDAAGSKLVSSVKDWLGDQLPGVKKAYFDITSVPTKIIEQIAQNDLVAALDKAIDSLKDPEELPIMELRINQDLSAVVDTKLGREEGKGQKAPRARVRFYRNGSTKVQIQDAIFINLDADGTVELDCGEIKIDATNMTVSLSETSNIFTKDVLQIGVPTNEFKKVTLDKDNVREKTDGLTTRNYVQLLANKAVMSAISPMFAAASIAITAAAVLNPLAEPALTPLATIFTTLVGGMDVAAAVPGPLDNAVIGKTESSSDHLKGN